MKALTLVTAMILSASFAAFAQDGEQKAPPAAAAPSTPPPAAPEGKAKAKPAKHGKKKKEHAE